MISRTIRICLFFAASAFAIAASDGSSATAAADTPAYVPGTVIVAFEPGHSRTTAGIAPTAVESELPGAVALAVPEGRELEYAAEYAQQPGVAFAEPDYLRFPQFIPNDPEYHLQWNMRLIQAEQAWEITRGEGVTIGVVDTGVAFENYGEFGRSPELQHPLFVFPYNATDETLHPNDDNGHGTHVTSTLVQDSNNGVDAAGLVPNATIIPIKVCQPFGCPSSAMAKGIRWAVDHGANVINISLGGATISQIERQALAYAEDNGVVVVAATGNGGGDFVGDPALDYPAAANTVIAAGSVNYAGLRAGYSNYGSHDGGGGVLVMAPGGDTHADLNQDGFVDGIVQTTYSHACLGGAPDFKSFTTCFYNGTSMATPHVTATVAMLLSRYPNLTPAQVRTIVACSALDLGPPGIDAEYGSGLVHAASAMVDVDGDGIPNCLEARPEVRMSISSGPVVPGGTIELVVRGFTIGGAISNYDFEMTFDPELVQPIGCIPRKNGQCSGGIANVRFTGVAPGGFEGGIEIGRAVFRANGQAGDSALLDLHGRAGGFSETDPQAVIVAFDGRINIMEVPETVSGDLNCDGKVNSVDISLSIQANLELAKPFCIGQGDVNCSGFMDISDVLAMLTFLADLPLTLPAGCPLIGIPETTPTPVPTPTPEPTPTPTAEPEETPTQTETLAATASPTP